MEEKINIDSQPLVSIIVITYNSSKYVLETLESAKAQTYENIELIISDDGSKDDTVQMCKDWLGENKKRFVRTELVTVEKNTGTSANCNRGLYASKGDWIKLIAGDDMLTDNCIHEFVNFSNRNPEAEFIASNILALEENRITKKIKIAPYLINRSARGQLKMLCRFLFFIPGPSMFLNRNRLIQLGGYDERYNLVEDFPFLFKAMKDGVKFYHLDKELVVYRVHESSISRGKENKLKATFGHFFNAILYPYLNKNDYLLLRHFKLLDKLESETNTSRRILMSFYIRLTDYYYWYFHYHSYFFNRKKWKAVKEIKI